MKKTVWLLGCVLFAIQSLSTPAATTANPGTTDTLLFSQSFERLSVGLDYEYSRRTIKPDDLPAVDMQVQSAYGFLGYDVLPWLTGFVTAGGDKMKFESDPIGYSDPKMRWSVGGNANLWHLDNSPKYPEWRLSFKSIVELTEYEADHGDLETLRWSDFSVTLPFGYEILFDRNLSGWSEIYSIQFYGGPIYSVISGNWERPGKDQNFSADKNLGLVGGVDLYFQPNISIGARAEYFDSAYVGADIRYHFQ